MAVMSKAEMAKLVKYLVLAYPSQYRENSIPDLFELWELCLGEVSFEDGKRALIKWIKQKRFPPTVNEFLTLVDPGLCYDNYFERKFYNDDSYTLEYTDEELDLAGGEKAIAECRESIRCRLKRKKTPEEKLREKEAYQEKLKEIKKIQEERSGKHGRKMD